MLVTNLTFILVNNIIINDPSIHVYLRQKSIVKIWNT